MCLNYSSTLRHSEDNTLSEQQYVYHEEVRLTLETKLLWANSPSQAIAADDIGALGSKTDYHKSGADYSQSVGYNNSTTFEARTRRRD